VYKKYFGVIYLLPEDSQKWGFTRYDLFMNAVTTKIWKGILASTTYARPDFRKLLTGQDQSNCLVKLKNEAEKSLKLYVRRMDASEKHVDNWWEPTSQAQIRRHQLTSAAWMARTHSSSRTTTRLGHSLIMYPLQRTPSVVLGPNRAEIMTGMPYIPSTRKQSRSAIFQWASAAAKIAATPPIVIADVPQKVSPA
jgi:UTP:GlnB (protein PII) uridylyltransferase